MSPEIVEASELATRRRFGSPHMAFFGGRMKDIAEWWPLLHEQIRRVLVNGIWMPVSDFARSEIQRLGGPRPDDAFWDVRDGERYMPNLAVQWIIKTNDFKDFLEPPKPDPRAAYFRRSWPQRRP